MTGGVHMGSDPSDTDFMDMKSRSYFRMNILLPMVEIGLIEMTIPDKPNSSKQKYRARIG